MLVLLQFNGLGFSALHLVWLFLLCEVAGIATNLGAGWLAARFGLAATLYAGLGLQVAALAQLDPGWSIPASVTFVMAVQSVSGVAKDLAKMSSKSAVKLLAPSGDGGLIAWVAALTGSKNAVKGLGFFLGAALLELVGFKPAIWGMAGYLVPIPFALSLAVRITPAPAPWPTATILIGLFAFGLVFVVNSSGHSYLILAFGDARRITRAQAGAGLTGPYAP
ncbi:hypothetical protein C8J30_11312 [Rhodobacter viridis]|uniref:Uncharacterized protein n=1 Tax=Rhodobacter viridis TaxID=1054202 RepID=A0A318U173_9RHOB|nr:hypothetical protein C8J30_11312 [Rhodobacter viridis]